MQIKKYKLKDKDMELIAEYPVVMDKDIHFGGFLAVHGIVYRMCMYSPDQNILAVTEVPHFDAKPGTITADDFICPYCKSVDYDAWELRDAQDETCCSSCESLLEYTRIIHETEDPEDFACSYKVKPIEKAAFITLS